MARLTVKQAAAYVPISMGTLNRLRVAGGGPRFIKLGGKVLYDVRDLDIWMEENKRSSTSDLPHNRRGEGGNARQGKAKGGDRG